MKRVIPYDLVGRYRTPLMGVAIMGVLLGHWISLSSINLASGVERVLKLFTGLVFTQGFLFLSGFGLYFSFSKNHSVKEFYKRRVFRLLVPFIIISAPYFLFEAVAEHQGVLPFLGHISTISYWFEGNYSGMWYIAASCILYLAYPFIHRFVFVKDAFWLVTLKFIFCCVLFIGVNEVLKGHLTVYWDVHSHFFSQAWIFVVGMYFAYIANNQDISGGGTGRYISVDLFKQGNTIGWKFVFSWNDESDSLYTNVMHILSSRGSYSCYGKGNQYVCLVRKILS